MTQFRGIDPLTEDNWLVTKVKQNPEAFLVLAAGCALLLRATGTTSPGTGDYRTGDDRKDRWSDESRLNAIRDRTTAAARNVASDLQDRVKDTATAVSQKASDYATALSDKAGAISEQATGYVASLSDQASDWGRSVADETARMGTRVRSSTQDGLGRMVKEQPLAVAALGIAAGAAIAALLPPTRVERDALRPLGDVAKGAVAAGLAQVKHAASATAEQIQDDAQRRGLSAEGIKDMAREATQTFADKIGATREPEASPLSGARM
jgi:hypothetical protein